MLLDRLCLRLNAVVCGLLLFLVLGQGEALSLGGKDWGLSCQILQRQDVKLQEGRPQGGGEGGEL